MPEQNPLKRLLEAARLMHGSPDLRFVLEKAAEAIREEMKHCHGVAVILAKEDATRIGGDAEFHHYDQWAAFPPMHEAEIAVLWRHSALSPEGGKGAAPRFLLSFPITDGVDDFGVICLFNHDRPIEMDEETKNVLQFYAHWLALAVSRHRQLRGSGEDPEMDGVLHALRQELSLCSTENRVWKTCLKYAEKILNNPNLAVFIYDESRKAFARGTFNPRGRWGKLARRYGEDFPLFSEYFLTKTDFPSKPVWIPYPERDPRIDGKRCREWGIRNMLVVPMTASGNPLGVLAAVSFNASKRYRDKQLRLLQCVTETTALVLSGVKRFEQLEHHVWDHIAELREKNKILERVISELRRVGYQNEIILNAAGEGIFGLNLEGEFTFLNPAAAKMLGYQAQELIGEKHARILHPGAADFLMEKVRHMAENSDLFGRVAEVAEEEYVRKDGTAFFVEYVITPLCEHGCMVGVVVVFRDITERKKTEELIRKADKLSAIGELAAGIAHEIRNPLTTLRGFIQLLQRGELRKHANVEVMLSELDRINFVVSELLVLAKPQAAKLQSCDLRSMLDGVIALLKGNADSGNVRIELKCAPSLPPVLCEESQLKQAFLNILKNSIEAMPQGGVLRVKVFPQKHHAVTICVIDTGCGIPKDRLGKLGEPFYTTKEKGTGLGLTVAFQIVKRHRGTIRIASKENKGTKVEVVLPVSPPLPEADGSFRSACSPSWP